MTTDTQVLIVGAGPTGLVLACQLQAKGVAVRLIDRLAEPTSTSRAFTIHARTLELLDRVGLADAFTAASHKTHSMDYHFPGKEDTPRLDFRALDSVYPYCLTIAQAETERLLRERLAALGGQVEWRTRLVDLEVDDEGARARLTRDDADGHRAEETLSAAWLIGCDGYYSTVRQQLALEFDGSEYAGTMRMMDVPLTGYSGADDAIHYHIARDHMLLITKLPGACHRVLISDKTEGVAPEQAHAAFQAVADAHFAGAVQLGEPEWITNFRISKRQTDAYRRGRVFLAGDAAHVNSPAGGQGMNVAMQDAFNLAWKLAAVACGEAPEALLDTYEAERRPVASQMLEGTSYIHSIIMAHGKGMHERIALMKGGAWNAEAVNQVAGISYTYRDPDDPAPLAVGDRAPDVVLTSGLRAHDLLRAPGHVVLLFADEAAGAEGVAQARAAAAALTGRYRASVTPRVILPTAAGEPARGADELVDDGALARRYQLAGGGACVVRPDLHVAYLGPLDRARDALDAQLTQASAS